LNRSKGPFRSYKTGLTYDFQGVLNYLRGQAPEEAGRLSRFYANPSADAALMFVPPAYFSRSAAGR
jgi:hypothetical protein